MNSSVGEGASESVRSRSARRDSFIASGVIVLIGVITYLPLVSQLGFYRDDWFVIWSGRTRGAASIVDLFAIDRPVMGYLYSFVYSLLGDMPIRWHIYAFILRVLGGLVFFWLVRRLFPGERIASFVMAALFLVYPGFLQQPNANTFQNQLFSYGAGLTSILLTVLALQSDTRRRAALLTALSILFGLVNLLLYEYMIGLEGLRLLLIWYLRRGDGTPNLRYSIRQLLRSWFPYAVPLSGYLFWRVVVFKSTRGATDLTALMSTYAADPFRSTGRVAIETVKDFFETSVLGWFVPFNSLTESAGYRDLLRSGLLAGAACALIVLYWKLAVGSLRRSQPAKGLDLGAAVRLGCLGLVSALVPVVLAQRDVHFHSAFDRYTLHATFAVAILIGGLIFRVLPQPTRLMAVVFLVAVSIFTHFNNAVDWSEFWRDERQLWWQLSWRAPQIRDDTVLLVQIPSGGFREDYEIWGPANLIYHTDDGSIRIRAEILNERTAEKVRFGTREARGMRGLEFERDFNNALVLSMPTKSTCLHVLDRDRLELPSSSGSLIYSIASFSNVDMIEVGRGPSFPPTEIFGREPEHEWCYYYQIAELARQRGDWRAVVDVGDEVGRLGLRPADRSEWLPFLEGYVNVGRVEQSERIALLIRDTETIRKTLCDRLPAGPQPGSENYETMLRLLCDYS